MCGIAGKLYFNKDIAVQKDEILKMTGALSHRGPDDSGVFVDGNIGLGHRRLSIIDLSPLGHQPMSDPAGKIWVVYNGEIYNFIELRDELIKQGFRFRSRTDTEVIIYLYQKYGYKCVDFLQGMFAFAIWDTEKQELFIARDRLGKKPLKYYVDNQKIVFASELKAILENDEITKDIDYPAIDEYLTYQYIPHPKTGFKNILKLEPAHYLIVKPGGKIIKERYWNLNYAEKLQLTEAEWKNLLRENITDAVKRRLISDVPIGAHLSGGIDSGVITALMAKQTGKPISTFSIGFLESDYSELGYARKIAEKYGTNHSEIMVRPNAVEDLPKLVMSYEEPFADSSALPTWYLCRETRKFVTVTLNGDGGDENFAGYDRYVAAKLYDLLKFIPLKKQVADIFGRLGRNFNLNFLRYGRRMLQGGGGSFEKYYMDLISYFSLDDKLKLYNRELSHLPTDSNWLNFFTNLYAASGSDNRLDRILFADINSYLTDDLLVKVDIASMAHALEIRSPLLDDKLIELTAKLPANLKIKGFNKKYILKQIAYDLLPRECIDRPKKGFAVPLEHWFRNDLKQYIKEILLDETLKNFGFNTEYINRLIDDHQSGKINNGYKLWSLLTFRHWLEIYFKK